MAWLFTPYDAFSLMKWNSWFYIDGCISLCLLDLFLLCLIFKSLFYRLEGKAPFPLHTRYYTLIPNVSKWAFSPTWTNFLIPPECFTFTSILSYLPRVSVRPHRVRLSPTEVPLHQMLITHLDLQHFWLTGYKSVFPITTPHPYSSFATTAHRTQGNTYISWFVK